MSDLVVLVTGGAGALGGAVTRAFLRGGARVFVPLYHQDPHDVLDPLEAEFPDRVNSCALDLTTERGAAEAIRSTVEWAGRVDAVAHLVGGYAGGRDVAETDVEVWDRMMDLNLKSAWLVARAAIPPMLEAGGGSLVFVGSRAARVGRARHAAYAVAKAGVAVLAEAVSEEFRGRGVRANVVLPGTIDTPANRRSMPDADASSWTSPERIAEVVRFLASPESEAVVGAQVPVYGRS